MLEITPLSAQGSAPQPTRATAPANSAGALDYNAFLRLLVAQMQNQDPLNPIEGTEYTSQLAQFSNLEQSIQMNQKLEALMSSLALSQADSLIGRTVTSADESVTGVIEKVTITSVGPLATLEGGEQLLLGPGVTIS